MSIKLRLLGAWTAVGPFLLECHRLIPNWRRDIERTREKLPRGKLLNVSVVGTFQHGWSLDDLANDYARCAYWAVDSGADSIETNLSCPNVTTRDGQLYQNPDDAGVVV